MGKTLIKKRIIINNQTDEITDEQAMKMVSKVIEKGRVAMNHTQYATATHFDDFVVITERTQKGNETFRIYKEREAHKWKW